eukprot:6479250-Prymnesium_polylepis.2
MHNARRALSNGVLRKVYDSHAQPETHYRLPQVVRDASVFVVPHLGGLRMRRTLLLCGAARERSL